MNEKEKFIEDLRKRTNNEQELLRLLNEANEISKIMTKAKSSMYSKQ